MILVLTRAQPLWDFILPIGLSSQLILPSSKSRERTRTAYPEDGCTCLVVIDIVILHAIQHVLFSKYVCAACRAAPAAHHLNRLVHAMLGIDVLSGV